MPPRALVTALLVAALSMWPAGATHADDGPPAAGTTPPGTPATAPLTTPLDPEWGWLVDLSRRGALGSSAAELPSAPARHPVASALAAGPLAAFWAAPTIGSATGSASDAETVPHAATLLHAWSRRPLLPADRSWLGASLQARLTTIGLHTDPAWQLRPDFLDLRTGDAVDPAWRHRAQLVGAARFHQSLTAGVHFTFDTRGDNDPRNRTRTFSQLDASNNFDAAWLRAELGPGALTLGRVPMGWGPEREGGLLLSATAPAPDMIHGALRWGPHRLQTFAGQLSSRDVDGANTRRWLYGHRADLFFLDHRLRLAISETVVAAGPNESLNLRYLNPIPLWAQIQVEQDGDDGLQVNVIDMVDGELVHDAGALPGLGALGLDGWTARWYGSLAVDDVQIDPEGRDRNPDQLAWSAGLDLSRPDWLLGYEYRRLGTWTYLHRGEGSGHTTFERPLGAPEGPDTDRHHLVADWRPAVRWRLWTELERRRRGENRITTTDPKRGNVGLPFPRGTVEKRWIAAVGLEWAWANDRGTTAKAALRAALHSIRNVNNQPGVDEDVLELRLVLDLRAPALRWRAVAPRERS